MNARPTDAAPDAPDDPVIGRLLISCPDRRGIVAAVSRFLADGGGNILDADQHTDPDDGQFFMRVEFEWPKADRERFVGDFQKVADAYGMSFRAHWADVRKRLAILVSRQDHCLQDLLYRHRVGELHADIACIISNHPDCGATVASHGLRFFLLPVTPETKPQQEARLLEVLEEVRADAVVLARYMQVLSSQVVDAYAGRCINIHHGFLPAFAGGRPYHQAHERGVKLIGATSHYVTSELDAGPILAQAVAPVSHRDAVADLVRKGRDLERTVLASAVRAHLADKVLVHQNRTIVFD